MTLLRSVGIHVVRFMATVVAASLIIFALLRLIPGDPAIISLGVNASPELVAAKQHELGTDQPLVLQYATWISGLATGHCGISLTSGTDITPLVADRLQVSLILMGTAVILCLLIALPLGTWAAMRRRHTDGVFITAASQVGISIPSFLAGILLVTVFAVHLKLLPPNSWVPPEVSVGAFLSRLVLPATALAGVQSAIMTRYVRSAVLDVNHQDFMRTALSKGMTPWQALRRHGLRHAALPVVTVTGIQVASLIVGAVVIERVFTLPGLGSYLLDAVNQRDLTTVQSVVMVLVFITLFTNLMVDISYTLLDPRIRAKGRK